MIKIRFLSNPSRNFTSFMNIKNLYSVPYTGSNVMIDISDVLREKAEEDMRLLIEEIRHYKKMMIALLLVHVNMGQLLK